MGCLQVWIPWISHRALLRQFLFNLDCWQGPCVMSSPKICACMLEPWHRFLSLLAVYVCGPGDRAGHPAWPSTTLELNRFSAFSRRPDSSSFLGGATGDRVLRRLGRGRGFAACGIQGAGGLCFRIWEAREAEIFCFEVQVATSLWTRNLADRSGKSRGHTPIPLTRRALRRQLGLVFCTYLRFSETWPLSCWVIPKRARCVRNTQQATRTFLIPPPDG